MLRDLMPVSGSQRKVDRWFDSFFDDDFFRVPLASNDMKVDIKETDDKYVFEIEMPGIDREQVKIDYRNGYLTVGVIKNDEIKEEKKNYIRRERRSGSFSRTFRIGNLDKNSIDAKMENGLLTVSVPKEKKEESHYRIDIK